MKTDDDNDDDDDGEMMMMMVIVIMMTVNDSYSSRISRLLYELNIAVKSLSTPILSNGRHHYNNQLISSST